MYKQRDRSLSIKIKIKIFLHIKIQMKIIYIFDCAINEIKYRNMSTLLLFCFVLFCFDFLLLKVIDFSSKLNQLTLFHPCNPGCYNTCKFYFLSQLIDSHSVVFILN